MHKKELANLRVGQCKLLTLKKTGKNKRLKKNETIGQGP